MMMLRRALHVTVAALIASAIVAAPANASGSTKARICLHVMATGVGQDLGNFMTTATISSHGVVLGTTNATFTPTGGDATTVTFTGPIVFTTRIGALTAQVDGMVNTATGAFVSQSTSVNGTGAFSRVTGDVKLVGTEDLQTGAFTETITGRLCARFSH
jgi:hypothetical protein